MPDPAVTTRFAPSPTGRLHLGNARTALFNYLLARAAGGRFVLRIEDTDPDRCLPVHESALIEDLRWLGLRWDEGPDRDGGHGPYRQSQRRGTYETYFGQLRESGHAYPCFCTEAELEADRQARLAAGAAPRYSGRCRDIPAGEAAARLAAGEPAALRFRVVPGGAITFDDFVRGSQSIDADGIGDFIIRRSDGTPSFFFSNAVDDALMGVSHVLRGEDHLANTPRQLLLLQALGLAAPRYGHLALVVDENGAPLSKRRGSPTLEALRGEGVLPSAVTNYLARAGHAFADPGCLDLAALAAGFRIEALGRAPTRFDVVQLEHWQQLAVRALDAAAFEAWADLPRGLVAPGDRAAFFEAVRANCARPGDVAAWAGVVFSDDWPMSAEAVQVIDVAGAGFFAAALAALEAAGTGFDALVAQLKRALPGNARGPALFQPLRAALTGVLAGPELRALLPLMGVARARRRLEDAARRARAAG